MIDALSRNLRLQNLPETGRSVVVGAWTGTGVFVVSAVLSTLVSSLRIVGVVVALALFAAGCLAFLSAFAAAVERSRTEEIGIGGLYFLAGSAPTSVRWHLLGALAVQVVTAFTTASIRPFTAVAFGILVPMYGLGMAGLWAARHGHFPARTDLKRKKQRP